MSGERVGAVPPPGLRVLAVDDEAPSLADLVFELRRLPGVDEVIEANDATSALRSLRDEPFDAVFLDVRMPGLDGLELARVLGNFRTPPPVVFVTAFDAHAVDAFEIDAVDYLLKPVRSERLEQALAKIVARRALAAGGAALTGRTDGEPRPSSSEGSGRSPLTSSEQPELAAGAAAAAASVPLAPAASAGAAPGVFGGGTDRSARHPFDDEMLSVEVGGRIRVIDRRAVQYVSSSGDYVRLHLATSSVLVRVAMSTLEERWAEAGFVRIHRSSLVALAHVDEVRVEPGRGYVVRIGERTLPVSRRSVSHLRRRLVEDAARRSRNPGGT
jgi:DNA-binding LytR/AlgR family response regulator